MTFETSCSIVFSVMFASVDSHHSSHVEERISKSMLDKTEAFRRPSLFFSATNPTIVYQNASGLASHMNSYRPFWKKLIEEVFMFSFSNNESKGILAVGVVYLTVWPSKSKSFTTYVHD